MPITSSLASSMLLGVLLAAAQGPQTPSFAADDVTTAPPSNNLAEEQKVTGSDANSAAEPAAPAPAVTQPRIRRAPTDLQPLPAPMTRPIRELRRLSLLGEVSFNGLSGIGGNVGYQFSRHLAVDAGLGVGIQEKPKVGLRLRFQILPDRWSPFVAVGATFVPGDKRPHAGTYSSGEPYMFQYHPLAMVQGVVGVHLVADNGFTFVTGVGAAVRVTKQRPYTIVPEMRYQISSMVTELMLDSGPLFSVAFGYSFR